MKKNLKKFLSVILCLVMLVSLCSCFEDSPEETVSYVFDSFKSGDEEVVGQIFDKSDFISDVENEYNEAFKTIFANMDYEIVSVNENADKASVIIKITNKDYENVAKKVYKNLESYAMKNPEVSEENLEKKSEELILEEINKASKSDKTVTNQVEFILIKDEDGFWDTDKLSDEVINAMTGNLFKGMEEL
ncbi:DUF5105 domain-containing protein [Anaerofustis butyriciformans]|uniref:DUF5105 domain-containing protein n=1 Tax=Anaerofustis butyriciformans TaxID=3108533 RepID=UPI003F8B33E6